MKYKQHTESQITGYKMWLNEKPRNSLFQGEKNVDLDRGNDKIY